MTLRIISLCICLTPLVAVGQSRIIDMHQHAIPADFWGESDPEWFQLVPERAASDDELISQILAAMERYNIEMAAFSGAEAWVERWKTAAPTRVLRGSNFASSCDESMVSGLRELHETDGFEIMGEISWQWAGISPADPDVEPCFALANELDIPMGIHLGLGIPGANKWSGYRPDAGRPLDLVPMLTEYPDSRVYIMHAGWPLIDETIAVLHAFPNVYVDLSLINWFIPRAAFHDALLRLIDAGFEDRLMFGSDAGVWPEAIGLSIEGIRSASFLSDEQLDAIFYGNAARFLRLEP